MSILPGFQKYKRHIRIGDDYILDSEWTHAKTVEMSDGSTLDDTVSNINREITATRKSVSDGKSAVASAITAQGVTTAADATFNVMAANVTAAGNARYNAGVAATKVGTAAAANVLSGKTFTNASTVGLTGTMTDYSANPQAVTLSSAQTGTSTLSLPAGYHSSVQVDAANVYSAGIAAADARTNENSANYQAGYNAGVAAGGSGKTVSMQGSNYGIAFYKQHVGNPDLIAQRVMFSDQAEILIEYGSSLFRADGGKWYTPSDFNNMLADAGRSSFGSAGGVVTVINGVGATVEMSTTNNTLF